ncbi:P-loop containing nucleoside triphosphate hydrolase protein [Gautieria morchelliformis]|nr:P-loop containing nucleoside triphosphate hydrolase protein [Gautieria morchelliformis]
MDDGLVLNISQDSTASGSTKRVTEKRGGRWTERLKAKRVSKRKGRAEESVMNRTQSQPPHDVEVRPPKRLRVESSRPNDMSRSEATSSRPTQYISSLFSSNPIISVSSEHSAPRKISKPSNAPVNASTFEGLGLSPLIISHLSTKMGISQPTSIQRTALPSLLGSTELRDAFIQSQTGSGKTLSFLLPIIQDLLPLSSLSYIDRSIGTLAIIIAPTRELAKQISDVLEVLLTLRLRPPSDDPDDSSPDLSSQRLTRWLVSGLLTGGATRTHEKARLRKGIPILVSTPGRLLDHLQNTTAFDVGRCRWLVLDEADRLMDLGFEETIKGILKSLDGRRKLAVLAEQEGGSSGVVRWDWKERRNVLCSATIREDVQKLAGVALNHPVVIKAIDAVSGPSQSHGPTSFATSNEKFTPPSQLTQKFVVVPLKLRLVTLVALLRTLLTQDIECERQHTRIIVFLSCTDSVDFHWNLLGGAVMDGDEGHVPDSSSEDDLADTSRTPHAPRTTKVKVQSTLLPNTHIYRLHGSLPLETRLTSLKGFSSKPSNGESPVDLFSILLCTSVASRGLDLPLVRAVIQHDLPTEGGATEYVHRVGRTARVGKGGEAWAIVSPSEERWVPWVEERMGETSDNRQIKLQNVSVEGILRSGFGGQGKEYEARATQVQLSFERWVLRSSDQAELARKAYVSHMRAYATHPSDEKHLFHVRHLHLGHLAKAFALREAPNTVTTRSKGVSLQRQRPRNGGSLSVHSKSGIARGADPRKTEDAEQRMTAVVRMQGRLSKKGGFMVTSGTSEFQIADGNALERLVRR